MARKTRKADVAEAARGRLSCDAKTVKAALADHLNLRGQAKAAAGEHGQARKEFCDKFSLNKKAWGFLVSLGAMDELKRQACLRDFVELADKVGYFNQKDLFDNIGKPDDGSIKRSTPGISGSELNGMLGETEPQGSA